LILKIKLKTEIKSEKSAITTRFEVAIAGMFLSSVKDVRTKNKEIKV
jgi:hypothetical protein